MARKAACPLPVSRQSLRSRPVTFRPLNKCQECGKTWYPRGTDLSNRCPECKSTNIVNQRTTYNTTLLGWVLLPLGLVVVCG